jgi:hypothetical protein
MTETPEQKALRELDVKLLVSGWIVQNRDEIDLTARWRQAPTNLRRVALQSHMVRFLIRHQLFLFSRPRPAEKNRQNSMKHDCRPQEWPNQISGDGYIAEVKRREEAII